jgi:hypothetical protein
LQQTVGISRELEATVENFKVKWSGIGELGAPFGD